MRSFENFVHSFENFVHAFDNCSCIHSRTLSIYSRIFCAFVRELCAFIRECVISSTNFLLPHRPWMLRISQEEKLDFIAIKQVYISFHSERFFGNLFCQFLILAVYFADFNGILQVKGILTVPSRFALGWYH